MKKRLTVLLLALVMVISSAVGVMAAPTDFVNTETGISYSLLQAASSKSIILKLASSPSAYRVLDSNGSAYSLKEVLDLIATGLTYDQALVEANPVEEVELELKVVEVSAITKTYVDVKFDAVTEAMEDVTIEVVDNNGEAVEVKAVDLVAGETTATFTFTKALTEDPEGVWNVGGVIVDLDLAANLKAVYTASTQVKLLEGLNKLELTDVKAENITHYQTELTKVKDSSKDTYVAEADFTKVNAQAVVTAGNKAALEAADETAIVKAVNEAKTQVALLEALASFERINADWIVDYDTALGTAETEIKLIQGKIDVVNAGKVNPKVAALSLDAAGASIVKKDLNDAKALVTDYQNQMVQVKMQKLKY